MSDTVSLLTEVIRELVSTPNGQIRLVGAVLCIGPGYSIFAEGMAATNFGYAMIGLGAILIMVSAVMAVIAARFHAEQAVDERREGRDSCPPSERVEMFCKQILNVPRSKADLSDMKFDMYDGMLKDDLYRLLMQSTAKETILSGLARFQGGKYIGRDVTEQTIMVVRE